MAASPPLNDLFFSLFHLNTVPYNSTWSKLHTHIHTHTHARALKNTGTDTSTVAAGNIEVKGSLAGFLSAPVHSSFNDVRACEM